MLTNQNFSINTTSMNFPPSEPGGGALRQKKRQAPEAKKICRVCGDKAYSVNFNVITCESCKAFFRRNALKKKVKRNFIPKDFVYHISDFVSVIFIISVLISKIGLLSLIECKMHLNHVAFKLPL